MEVTDDRIQRVEQIQMEIINNNRSDRIKHDNIQTIEKGTVSSTKNQSDDGIDKFVKNAIDNEHYELAEARNAVKYVEHFVKAMKPVIDQNSAKPKDYDKWTNKEKCEHIIDNMKTYMPSIPDSLLFFIPAALHRADCGRNSTDKPVWLDMEKFQRGQKFARDHIFSIVFASMLSLFEIFTFPNGFKPIIFSQQSHTPHLAFKRYMMILIKSFIYNRVSTEKF